MLYKRGKFLSSSLNLPSAYKGLNFVGQLFDRDGELKTCKCLKDIFL